MGIGWGFFLYHFARLLVLIPTLSICLFSLSGCPQSSLLSTLLLPQAPSDVHSLPSQEVLSSQTSIFNSSDLENVPQTVCVPVSSLYFCILDENNEWSQVFNNNDDKFITNFKISQVLRGNI